MIAMDFNKFKNLDRQVKGINCYDYNKAAWVIIREICGENAQVENESGTIYIQERSTLYPIAEGLRLDRDREQLICYEIDKDIDYPYYCPEYDENENDFEVVDITKTFKSKALESIDNNKPIEETTSNDNLISINVGKKNARLMVDMLIASLEQLYRRNYAEYYDVDEEAVPNIYFVRNYIDRLYDTYKDNPEVGVSEVYKALETFTLEDYLDEIFTEEVLHNCHRVIITEDLMESLPNTELEDLIDKVNSLEDAELLLIYNGDVQTIEKYQKDFDIKELRMRYLSKIYKIKCEVVQKYIVEVEATNEEEANQMALADLDKVDKPNNCIFVESYPKLVKE